MGNVFVSNTQHKAKLGPIDFSNHRHQNYVVQVSLSIIRFILKEMFIWVLKACLIFSIGIMDQSGRICEFYSFFAKTFFEQKRMTSEKSILLNKTEQHIYTVVVEFSQW
jgi:hypothetical protein